MATKLGEFTVVSSSSQVKAGEIYFGREGNDNITSQGLRYSAGMPSILSGGSGGDSYSAGGSYNDYTVIVDASNSNGDTLNINHYASTPFTLYSVDNRHLFLEYGYLNSTIFLVDGLNTNGAMESIVFNDYSVNGSPDKIGTFLNQYTKGNLSFDELLSKGLVKTSDFGVSNVSEIKLFLDDISTESNDEGSKAFEMAAKASDLVLNNKYMLELIKDYDANLHGYLGTSAPANVKASYKYQGKLDVNNDGVTEAIFTNKESGRWVTASIDPITGAFDYTKHGAGGTTRIVGIYEDPLVQAGVVEKDSPNDGSRTFINDLKLDNLILKTVGDYDGDGFQEVYWSKVDNTAYLRAVMHADGNIQYANYQSLDQMTDYLTSHGFVDTVALIA